MTGTAIEPKTLKLPDALRSHHDALVKALATPIFFEWDDEGLAYVKADQPAAIGRVLISAIHYELANAKIGYVFRKKMADHDRKRMAQASRVGGKLNYFSNLDLLIEVNHEEWVMLSDERRIALIDHELCHFSLNIDDDGKKSYALLSHDVEEFAAIVRRWGLWKVDLERFGRAVESSRQLDIFAKLDPTTNAPDGEPTRFADTAASFNGGPPTSLENAAKQMGKALAKELKGRAD
jgi:hypothetical protein